MLTHPAFIPQLPLAWINQQQVWTYGILFNPASRDEEAISFVYGVARGMPETPERVRELFIQTLGHIRDTLSSPEAFAEVRYCANAGFHSRPLNECGGSMVRIHNILVRNLGGGPQITFHVYYCPPQNRDIGRKAI